MWLPSRPAGLQSQMRLKAPVRSSPVAIPPSIGHGRRDSTADRAHLPTHGTPRKWPLQHGLALHQTAAAASPASDSNSSLPVHDTHVHTPAPADARQAPLQFLRLLSATARVGNYPPRYAYIYMRMRACRQKQHISMIGITLRARHRDHDRPWWIMKSLRPRKSSTSCDTHRHCIAS